MTKIVLWLFDKFSTLSALLFSRRTLRTYYLRNSYHHGTMEVHNGHGDGRGICTGNSTFGFIFDRIFDQQRGSRFARRGKINNNNNNNILIY